MGIIIAHYVLQRARLTPVNGDERGEADDAPGPLAVAPVRGPETDLDGREVGDAVGGRQHVDVGDEDAAAVAGAYSLQFTDIVGESLSCFKHMRLFLNLLRLTAKGNCPCVANCPPMILSSSSSPGGIGSTTPPGGGGST